MKKQPTISKIKVLKGIENVKIMTSVCEKVVYEGLLVILMFLKVKIFKSLFYLSQCKKNVHT